MVLSNEIAAASGGSPIAAYASGDLVADSSTPGSVTVFSFTMPPDVAPYGPTIAAGNDAFQINKAHVFKTGTGTTNASFRVHFYTEDPTATSPISFSGGDNAAFTGTTEGFCGTMDVTVDEVHTDGASGRSTTSAASILCPSSAIYALLEATAAYTPSAGEVFTLKVEGFRI